MSKPHIVQMGQLPERDEAPLRDAYEVHRYFDAANKDALLASVGSDKKPLPHAAIWARMPM